MLYEHILKPLSEKKLAIALKTLLVLEAIAKVALVVTSILISNGKPLHPHPHTTSLLIIALQKLLGI